MNARCVLDASVAGAVYFTEEHSVLARSRVAEYVASIAPHLIFLEVGNIAAMKVRRGQATKAFAGGAVSFIRGIVTLGADDSDLADRAATLALDHGFTSYDACYLALAEQTGLRVLTADQKLVRRSQDCGFGGLVEPLV